LVAYCDRDQIAFIPWFPLEAGEVLRGGVRQYLRRLTGRAPWQSALERIANRHGATRSQIALAWLLGRSPVMLPIPGTSRPRHLEENMAAANIELSSEEFAELR